MPDSTAFTLVREQYIDELQTMGRWYRHTATGAQLLSLENDDDNKVFGINFFTPPATSNGIAHIMEHSVLCGSRKYPLKEPFVELIKGSLNTFLNAFTYPDMTCYPVASQNVRDLYNLIDVYLDAVFYPRLDPYTLKQEGWHFELDDAGAPLTYKGVVFNEMKGVYSSPDQMTDTYSQMALLEGTIYGINSGGDPAVIPTLTYEEFKHFHDTYYHPSNAFIFFYGNDDPAERLRYLATWLDAFSPAPVRQEVVPPPVHGRPRQAVYPIPGGDGRGVVTVNWQLGPNRSPEQMMALDILATILTGTPASPLRKALIDSGLGEDLTDSGLSSEKAILTFSVGLKGIDTTQSDVVVSLIEETLRRIANDGIDPDTVAAAMNTTEFALRELNTGRFPRGLALMVGMLRTWMNGTDPLTALSFASGLQRIKDRLAEGDRFFEQLIVSSLLENPERVTVVLQPDAQVMTQRAEDETRRLDVIRQSLTPDAIQTILDETTELKRRQNLTDSPEALATLPRLTVADLPRQHTALPTTVVMLGDTPTYLHHLATNGIVYWDVGLNLHALPASLIPYVNLFSEALLKMGTQREDFVRLTQHIGKETGGISSRLIALTPRDRHAPSVAYLLLRAKAVPEKMPELTGLLRDILLTPDFTDRERFRQIVLEERAGLEAGLVPGGHVVALNRLKAGFTEADWLNEEASGVTQLFFLRDMLTAIETDWDGVKAKLETIRTVLVNSKNMLMNVTVDERTWQSLAPGMQDFITSLPGQPAPRLAWEREASVANEGLIIPAQVNYVAAGANIYDGGFSNTGALLVANSFLQTTWLWDRVRVQGGAYGGFSTFDTRSGLFAYVSYRDPNLLNTLAVYQGTGTFLRTAEIDQEEVNRTIIGTIGTEDTYRLPDDKGLTALLRTLTGEDDNWLQQRRDQILGTTVADFRQVAEALDSLNSHMRVVVLGAREAIEGANAERGANWLTPKVLL